MGKPLIAYTIETALQSNLDGVIVSSDDQDILDIAAGYGVKAILRPEEFANDIAPTLPVLQHAIAAAGVEYDAVMTLQPTSPLRTVKHINEALATFERHPDADSLVSVIKAPHKFVNASLMVQNGDFVVPLEPDNLILRRQDKPNYWGRNGAAIYITRINKISEYIFGGNILPYEMTKLESIDIDDMEDWQMAEAIMLYNNREKK